MKTTYTAAGAIDTVGDNDNIKFLPGGRIELPKKRVVPLSRKQRATLLDMTYRENALGKYHSGNFLKHHASAGRSENEFYERLEARGLIKCVERQTGDFGKHFMFWRLTEAGLHTVYNFVDYLPF